MAEFTSMAITTKGQALVAKLIAGEAEAAFTKVCTSSAQYNEDNLTALEELSDIEQTAGIAGIERVDDASVQIEASFSNTELTVGYDVRTLGLYATDPDDGEILFAAAIETSGSCHMPAYSGCTVSGLYVQLIVAVGNADSVTAAIDPNALMVRSIAAQMIAKATVKRDITIPTEGWATGAEESADGDYYVDIEQSDVTEEMVPVVSICPTSMAAARACGLSTTARTLDGRIRFYAGKAPAEEIEANLVLMCASNGAAEEADEEASGTTSDYVLPVATANRLGGVMIGENVNVEADGTISVDTDSMLDGAVATDAEVQEMLEDVFADDSGE